MANLFGDNLYVGSQDPQTQIYPLETYCDGKILQTTMICLKPSTIEDEVSPERLTMVPFCCGAEFYKAENLAISGTEMFEVGFVTDTANATYLYHRQDDNLAVFGSYAYSGGEVRTNDHTSKFVGGMVLQASENHNSTKAGTRLLLAYMPNGDNKEAEVGAMIDGDGTFAVAKKFFHVDQQGTVGFFGVQPKGQQVVHTNATDKLGEVITALSNLGLIRVE